MGRVNGSHPAYIPWQQLAGVDFLDPTRQINGHVHFATAADPPGLTATGGGRRIAAAAWNPHAMAAASHLRTPPRPAHGQLTHRRGQLKHGEFDQIPNRPPISVRLLAIETTFAFCCNLRRVRAVHKPGAGSGVEALLGGWIRPSRCWSALSPTPSES